jgi:hypothetical protein
MDRRPANTDRRGPARLRSFGRDAARRRVLGRHKPRGRRAFCRGRGDCGPNRGVQPDRRSHREPHARSGGVTLARSLPSTPPASARSPEPPPSEPRRAAATTSTPSGRSVADAQVVSGATSRSAPPVRSARSPAASSSRAVLDRTRCCRVCTFRRRWPRSASSSTEPRWARPRIAACGPSSPAAEIRESTHGLSAEWALRRERPARASRFRAAHLLKPVPRHPSPRGAAPRTPPRGVPPRPHHG